VLERPADERAEVTTATYQRGLDRFRERNELSTAEREFLAAHEDAEPPTSVPPPASDAVDSGVSNSQRPSE